MTLTPEQAIAALRRAAAQLRIDSASFESKRLAQGTINDSFTLDELADALRDAQITNAWTDHDGTDYPDQWTIPAPRIEP